MKTTHATRIPARPASLNPALATLGGARELVDVNLAYTAARQTFAFRHRHEQGVLRVSGADRLTWLNGLVTNDVLRQEPVAMPPG